MVWGRRRLDITAPDRVATFYARTWQALLNPMNDLVYNADGRSVHTVIIDGRVEVDGYRQSFVDEGRLFAKV